MKDSYIHAENMAVGYQHRPLIEGIDLTLRPGEIVTLIGPNGSGKSTILKSMIRQLPLISGAVYYGGQDMKDLPEKELAKKISILMTQKFHTERMSCEELVAMGRYPYTNTLGILTSHDRQIIKEAISLVQAEAVAEKNFEEISDGQRQRILLARAICQEPEVMVLDEPTSFLDIRHKLKLLSILKELVQKKKIAILLSLHELDLAQKISDRVICIRDHKVDRFGTPEEIFSDRYIEELFGLEEGSYDACFGSMELLAVKKEPEIFVIAGGGSGISTYRNLQRKGISFATGILSENDIDYHVGRRLAAEIISEKAFSPIREETYERAEKILKRCKNVMCTLKEFGEYNQANKKLLDYAGKTGKLLVEKRFLL